MTQWVLPTATSSYAVSLARDASGLLLDGWSGDAAPRPWTEPERLSFETLADTLPLEYAAMGTRQVSGAELIVDFGDGQVGARPDGPPEITFLDEEPRCRLTARFTAGAGRLGWTTVTETDRRHDVVRRWVRIDNTGSSTIELPRAFSAAWELPVGPGARIDYLGGRWSHEFTPYAVTLPAGELSIGSRHGTTSHTYSPVVTVSAVTGGASGPAYGIALAWSGSWRLLVDAVPLRDRVRVGGGVDDESAVITLLPGESFTSPESHGVFAPDGTDGVTRRWHDFQRHALARSTGPEHRPIVYNSWYATEFDVELGHQSELAAVAALMGTEVFVVDDGWFRGRNTDQAGLGDWTPDPVKFPDGLGPLISAVEGHGMRFGVWVEPEAVNPDSDLFRAHPDWVYRAADRELVTVRNQYVLDFGRVEVVAWAKQMLRDLLADPRISYLKWDMNRPISDGGRPGDVHGREWSLQHARGYYQVMTMLREEFPHVTVEACAGGGGRIDHAVLAISDVVWPSDETGPRDRLAIQHGFLSAYPPSVMSSWVTDAPDLVDVEPASFEFRFVVAMAGVLGIGSDLLAWDHAQRRRAAELVGLYEEIRAVVHNGRVVRHGLPADDVYAVEFGGGVEQGHRTCVLVYARSTRPETVQIRPTTLVEDRRYRLRGGPDTFTGGEAAAGIDVPFSVSADADVLVFEPAG